MLSLSIVIPTYDTAEMTLACCRAVVASGHEVIVVDDGSRDGTAELLAREVPSVRVVRMDVNRGFAVAANRGVSEALGDVVLLLNSDAIVLDAALDALLFAFERDAGLGAAGARLLNEDGTDQWSGGQRPTLAWMIGAVSGLGRFVGQTFLSGRRRGQTRMSGPHDWVSGAAMAFRRAVWRDAGPLSERYRFYCQDIEFCLRARRAGWNVRVVDEARVVHGLGKTLRDPKLLRSDLLTWGRAEYGDAWWWLARAALSVAAVFRRS